MCVSHGHGITRSSRTAVGRRAGGVGVARDASFAALSGHDGGNRHRLGHTRPRHRLRCRTLECTDPGGRRHRRRRRCLSGHGRLRQCTTFAGVDFQVGGIEELAFGDDEFDVVFAANSVQYAADLDTALRELARVCRPGGSIVAGLFGPPEGVSYKPVLDALGQFMPTPPPGGKPGGPFRLSAPGVLEAGFASAGIDVSRSGEVNCPFDYAELGRVLARHTGRGADPDGHRSCGPGRGRSSHAPCRRAADRERWRHHVRVERVHLRRRAGLKPPSPGRRRRSGPVTQQASSIAETALGRKCDDRSMNLVLALTELTLATLRPTRVNA